MNPILAISLSFILSAPAIKDPKPKPSDIEGTWIVTQLDGRDSAPKNGTVIMEFRFEKTKLFLWDEKHDGEQEAEYTIDCSKEPAHIGLMPILSNRNAPSFPGIISVEKDTMKLCFAKTGNERPTEFKGDVDKQIISLTLTRSKDK